MSAELDKFKRRLIRSVARILRDQSASEEAWNQLRDQTGTNCKKLWDRMRALTMKKLKRLLLAEDRADSLPAIVRPSLTDWLLFDLVLVNQKYDVIGRDLYQTRKEPEMLFELADMVFDMNVEMVKGDELVDLWIRLTNAYNEKGRQVSPMLLQRRWFQLKQLTRHNFYRLWREYRGNQRLWVDAQRYSPTPLQNYIAKLFPAVITAPFPEWEQLIAEKKVILPEEFEMKWRMKNRPKTTGDDKPDLVVIEPEIETIDLGMDSDDEGDLAKQDGDVSALVEGEMAAMDGNKSVNLAAVKQEPPDVDGLSNVQILEATHIPVETLSEDEDIDQEDWDHPEEATGNLKQQTISSMQGTDIEEATTSDITQEIEVTETQLVRNVIANADTEICDDVIAQEIDDSDELPDDIIKHKAEEYCQIKDVIESVVDDTVMKPQQNKSAEDMDDEVEDIIEMKANDFAKKVDMKKLVNEVVDELITPSMTFADDGIEIVDDGIEYVEDDDDVVEIKIKTETLEVKLEPEEQNEKDSLNASVKTEECENQEDAETAKIDLKLLMNPVVYTTKLDEMIVFKGKDFDSVKEQTIIDTILIESKPVSKKAINIEIAEMKEDKTKLNDSENKSDDDDLFGNDPGNESSESDTEIPDDQKVKPTSYLLQKPRSRSYNPIQLCKNPDFNTRLKRLTAGFFSYTRNRQFLSACKPMTIDVSKAFEHKLVNGTLHLKFNGGDMPTTVVEDDKTSQASSVVPSAMSVQSLFAGDNTDISIQDLVSAPSQITTVDLTNKIVDEIAERNKVINLRDLSEIRRINQKLLTAEVPPIRLESNKPPKPLQTIDTPPLSTQISEEINIKSESDNDVSKLPNDIRENDDIETNVNDILEKYIADEPKVVSVSGGQRVVAPVVPTPIQTNDVSTPLTDPWKMPRNKPGPKSRNQVYEKQRYQNLLRTQTPSRVPVTWISAKKTIIHPKEDESLITLDTLNKMINKIEGTVEKPVQRRRNYVKKEKTNILNNKATKPIVVDDHISNNTVNLVDTSEDVQVKPKHKSGKFCCWASEKVAKMNVKRTRMSSRHGCLLAGRDVCLCCCSQKLIDAMRQDAEKSQAAAARRVPTPNVKVVDSIKCGCVVKVKAAPTILQYKNPNKAGPRGRGFPLEVANVSDKEVMVPEVIPEPEPTPILKVNISFAPPPSDFDQQISNERKLEELQKHIASDMLQIPDVPPLVPPNANVKKIFVPVGQGLTVSEPMVDGEQRRIIIDGSARKQSEKSIIPRTVVHENITYLNSKAIHSKPKDSPIYLGKNKILLTTVKFPPHINGKPDIPVLQCSKVVPAIPLPPGVQLVLSPEGKLSYSLDPGVQLDEAQIATLPSILAAVQQQLEIQQQNELLMKNNPLLTSLINKGGPMPATKQLPSDGVIDITEDDESPPVVNDAQINAPDKSNNASTEDGNNDVHIADPNETSDVQYVHIENVNKPDNAVTERSNTELIDSTDITEMQTDTTEMQTNSNKTASELNSPKTSDISGENQNQETNKSTAGSRNLLSDLMEMSGISAEDSTPVLQESLLQVNVAPEMCAIGENAMPLQQDTVLQHNLIPEVCSIGDATPVQQDTILQDNLDPQILDNTQNETTQGNIIQAPTVLEGDIQAVVPQGNIIAVDQSVANSAKVTIPVFTNETRPDLVNLPELTPITSLIELKYACEHNGKFFKLDFNTGIMVPINVCIRKNIKTGVVPIRPKEDLIDLTDDVNDDAPVKLVQRKQPEESITPLRLFRSVVKAPNLLVRKRMLEKKDAEKINQRKNVEPRIQHKHRKQHFDKIEAKIDLVDSDAPMEEEYLVDSFDSDDESPTIRLKKVVSHKTTEPEDSADSSDDEPLAKKSLRIKSSVPSSNSQGVSNQENISIEKDSIISPSKENEEELSRVPAGVSQEVESTSTDQSKQTNEDLRIESGDREKTDETESNDKVESTSRVDSASRMESDSRIESDNRVETEDGAEFDNGLETEDRAEFDDGLDYDEDMDIEEPINPEIAFLEGNESHEEEDCILGF